MSQLSAVMPQATAADVMEVEDEPTKLKPDGDPLISLNPNAVSPRQFVDYATSLARSHGSALSCQFLPLRRTETEKRTLEALTSLLSANNALGIYSESPFLRPVTLLRPVQFAFPAKSVSQYPDPENMVDKLRNLADQKVTSLPLLAILSGAKPNAASLGFCTEYLTYSFTLELDTNTMRLLIDQSRQPNGPSAQYRLILRLAWVTTGLYRPRDKSNPSRVLASEVLPRCLSVRVGRRNVTLPDPIFHGGDAQKFGHRLRFAIDITDKIRVQLVRCRDIAIVLTWLHAPLEDHALPLLEMVGSGSCTPMLNQLLNLPLVQLTLDRVQPIPEFVRMFSSAVAREPLTDPPSGCKPPHLPSETPEALVGVYDFCRSPERVIAASATLAMVRIKLTSQDDLQSDGWIPVSLLCPLALTRIEIPVRSVNCDHLQCFDLSSYLTINKKRPRWSCPVCSSPAPFRDLRRDDFFVQLIADQCLKDAEMVHVDVNGQWRGVSKPVGNDSSAVISIKDSVSVIMSDNPAIAADSSLHNGTPTMAPCRLESNFPSSPVTPIEPNVPPFHDCVIVLDDDTDDDDDREGRATQPEKSVDVQSTSSSGSSGPPIPAVVTDEQSGELSSEALDSALSSDNPTHADLTPLQNATSTTTPCRLESNLPCSPVTPIEPNVPAFNDCVVLLDDDDQEGPATQPEKSADVHSTSSNDCSGQPLLTVVTDEQSGELSSETLDSALSSNNPTQDDVPSVQNGASTMMPCMLESAFLSNPVTPLNDFALPLEDTNEGNVITQLEQPTVVQLASSNGGRSQSLPAAASDQQSRKRAFVNLDSAPDDFGEELKELLKEDEKSLSTGTVGSRKRKAKPQVERYSKTEEILRIINSEEVVEYCQEKGLLPFAVKCDGCQLWMKKEILRQHTDGYAFCCLRCRRKKALRTGSIFQGSHLTIRSVLKLWLLFIQGLGVKQCEQDLGIAHKTASYWYAQCRKVCSSARTIKELRAMDVKTAWEQFLRHVAAAHPSAS